MTLLDLEVEDVKKKLAQGAGLPGLDYIEHQPARPELDADLFELAIRYRKPRKTSCSDATRWLRERRGPRVA